MSTERPPIEVTTEEWTTVIRLLDRYVPDREIWAIGSRAGGKPKAYSDLDLVVVGEQPLDLVTHAELSDAFAESALPFKVDIIDFATAGTEFRAVIEREHRVVRAA